MLPTLWEQFGDSTSLFQHDCAPVHKVRSTETWMSEKLDWSALSPVLISIKHLCDELVQKLLAKPPHPTSAPGLKIILLIE